MNRSIRSIVVTATTFALALAALGAEPPANPGTAAGDKPAVPTLVFYEIPGCPICKKINGWLDTLNKEHPDKVKLIRKPSSEALHTEMAARGIDHHGVVILTAAGEVSWRNDAHTLTEQALQQGFNQFVLGTPPNPAPAAQPAPSLSSSGAISPGNRRVVIDVKGESGQRQSVDVITGKPINRAVYADYDGRRIYFCCAASKTKLEQNAQAYLDAIGRRGIILEAIQKQ